MGLRSLDWAAQVASISTRRWVTRSPRHWTNLRATLRFALSSLLEARPVISIVILVFLRLSRSPSPCALPAASGPRTRPTMGDSSIRPWRCARACQKPVIAAISGTALAGAFEFALACDLRIAEDGEYLIGFPEPELGLLPRSAATQRLPRTIGTP